MRGILLAGRAGSSSAARPARRAGHPLRPVLDKPMIYYPLSTLMLAGVREVLVIGAPADGPALRALLRDGSHLGLAIRHAVQPEPLGIAHALVLGAGFIGAEKVALILGDTLLHGPGAGPGLAVHAGVDGAHLLAHRVRNPGDYGVVELDGGGQVLSIEEKPRRPRSDFAVPGLYFYDNSALAAAAELRPRRNGRLEITDLNETFRARGALRATRLGPGTAWLDTGSPDGLATATEFVRTVEVREGHKLGCIEEVAWRQGWIDGAELGALGHAAGRTGYGQYLRMLAADPPVRLPQHTVLELPQPRTRDHAGPRIG